PVDIVCSVAVVYLLVDQGPPESTYGRSALAQPRSGGGWLLGLGNRSVAFPALMLESDRLNGRGVSVGIEVREGLVLGNPAAVDLVSQDLLPRLIVNLDDDVLPKVC